MGKISVALIDDHPIMLEGLCRLFAAEACYRVVAIGDARQAPQIVEALSPGLVILGIQDTSTLLVVLHLIGRRFPLVRSIVYAGNPSAESAVRMLEAGARGYAAKTGGAEEILTAARLVASNEIYISRSFATGVITALRDDATRKAALQAMRLTARENQIIKLLLRGYTNRQIATELMIGEKTVKHYMTGLMQKLRARNRTEAVLAAQTFLVPNLPLSSYSGGPNSYAGQNLLVT
jgi:DNA-binding NarL/FixJ family response regulator